MKAYLIVDANKDIILHVMPIDVKGASKKNPAKCAAARAGQRELGKDVRVFITRTYVKEKKNWVRYITPESISREIISFDRGATFVPGEYQFKMASKGQKLGEYRGEFRGKTASRTNKRPQHATGLIRERSKYDSTKVK